MIRVDCEQGSAEWFAARLGIPTASQFSRIITPKTMKLSDSSVGYMHELIAEQLLGQAMDDGSSIGFMQRGELLERKAVEFYELQRDVETEKVGFVLRDDRRVGCSPDRFVGADGLLEIKCPKASNHIGYLLDAEGIGYRAQVQGQLWITGRAWVDTLSFNPDLPPALVRAYRDDEFITKLAQAVDQFLSFLDESKAALQKQYGLFPDFTIPDLRIA
jgi:hypothetical protein